MMSSAAAATEPGSGVSEWMVDAIAKQESQAERSLMHRFDTAQKVRFRQLRLLLVFDGLCISLPGVSNSYAQLVEQAGQSADTAEALTAVLLWLRLVGE